MRRRVAVLVLVWHQHQPLYPKDEDGAVTRPCVRLHAAKDYWDMADLVGRYPDLRISFNLTPVLLLQLEEIMEGVRDSCWVHTEVPAAELRSEQQAFLSACFFDVNQRIVERFPRYQELAHQRAAGLEFSTQDFLDLQVLFNLAWTDPELPQDPVLQALVDQGRDYVEADKAPVLAAHLGAVAATLEVHKRLWAEGHIEVTTTPLAHPILPLLFDTDLALEGDPTAVMPAERFREPIDARDQVILGLDVAERLLGRRPTGMWPGEGAAAQEVTSIWADEGIEWIATGERVLLPPLGNGDGLVDAGSLPEAGTLPAGFDGTRIGFSILLALLGPIEIGDPVAFRLVERTGGPESAMAPAAGPGVTVVPNISDVATAFEATDPEGDDHGPGTYTYPTDPVFTPGSYDLTAFGVGESGDDLVFTFDVLASIVNSWDSPNGVSIQTFDVYVDTDPDTSNGAQRFLPGRNAAWESGSGWDRALTIEGWYPALYVAEADGSTSETEPTFKVVIFPDRGRATARIPKALFGDGDRATWSYAVVVRSRGGYPSSGVRCVRDVEPTAAQWRIGGGDGSVNGTRILDLLAVESRDEEAMLSGSTLVTSGTVDALGDDDFAQITPLRAP